MMFEAFAVFDLEPPNPSRVNAIFDAWAQSYERLSGRPEGTATEGFTDARREVAQRPESR